MWVGYAFAIQDTSMTVSMSNAKLVLLDKSDAIPALSFCLIRSHAILVSVATSSQ